MRVFAPYARVHMVLDMRLLGIRGVGQYLQDRAKKESLIDEIKEILLDGSENQLSRYDKFGLKSKNGYLRLLMDLGNNAFHSGETEVIRYFLQVFFELATSGVLDEDIFLGRIQIFSLRSIHRFDYDSFAITLDGFIEYMCGLEEISSVNLCLQVLEKISFGAITEGNEACIEKLINKFSILNVHFETENMHVSKMYLGNLAISLVHFAEQEKGEALKNRLIAALMRLPTKGKEHMALLSISKT